MTRPEQCIAVEQALRAVTINAAAPAGPVARGSSTRVATDQKVMTQRPRVPPASRRRWASAACSAG